MKYCTISVQHGDVEKAFCSCCTFENVLHFLIEDLHSSETSALQVGLGECIHSLALYRCTMP